MTSTHSRPTIDEPRVWIGCLACYNEGRLRGDWFSAAEAADVSPRQIHGGRGTSHEELWVFDHDNIPVDGEFAPMDATGWAEVYDEVGAEQWPAICAWVRSGSYVAQGDTDLPVVSDFEEAMAGVWPSFTAYVEDLIDECGLLDDVPEELRGYFDTERYARDLAGDYNTEPAPGGEVYVFRCL